MKTQMCPWVVWLVFASAGCGRDALFQAVDDSGSDTPCSELQPYCVAHCGNDGLYQSTCVDGAWACPSATRRLDTCPRTQRDAGAPDGGATDAGTRDGGTTSACAGLDASRCRRTAGCVADTCMTCSCTPTFQGCRAANAPPLDCPLVGCFQPTCCRTGTECGASTTCAPPHAPRVCGICITGPTCESHDDCPAGEMCQFEGSCSCTSEGRCVPGCTDDADCAEGEMCTSQRRCIAKSCLRQNDCDPSFTCQAGTCRRKTCVSRDDECSPTGDSFCVLGQCASAWGECRPPGA